MAAQAVLATESVSHPLDVLILRTQCLVAKKPTN
jgi:hypothetical protein